MGSLWSFTEKPKNRQILAWAGSGLVIVAGGLWAAVTYVWPSHESAGIVCAREGSLAAGRNVSGNTINYSGNASPGASSGAVSCGDSAKK